MKNLSSFIGPAILLLVLGSCSHSNTYGPYFGKVVDAETKEPIEGAAVLVVFYTNQPGPAGSITRYADAAETVSDKNGEFKIPEHKVTSPKFLYLLDSHGHFTIFKPGYGCYPMHKNVKPKLVPPGSLPTNQYVVIEVPKLISVQERLTNTMIPIGSDVPLEKYLFLDELIKKELKDLGR